MTSFGGHVYFTPFGDLDNPVMGVVLKRMWWKPWRWSVQPIYYKDKGGHKEAVDGDVFSNLTLLGAVGMIKLMGVRHRYFE